MRIVIDCRMYGLEHAGIGRYVINLIDQIEKIDRENEYLLLLRKRYYHELSFGNPKIKKILADYPHYSFREQIFLPLQLIKMKPNLVHFPHFNVPLLCFGKYVVTIHDLIKHQYRGPATTTLWEPIYQLKHFVYKCVVWLAIKRACKIITPSYWWKKIITRNYQLSPDKVVVTYEGADEFTQKMPKKIRSEADLKSLDIQKPFVLYAGNLYPHKNVERLAQAVHLLYRKLGLNLVIAGSRNVFLKRFKGRLKKLNVEEAVKLVGFMDNRELTYLYQQAEVFVFPSLLEGFGLPGLEAMACGCPVIASNSSCLSEIYGSAALYFNPYSVEEIAQKIEKVIVSKQVRNKLIEAGFDQVKKYSWSKMAKETLKVYESCFSL